MTRDIKRLSIPSHGVDETVQIGSKLGRNLKGHEVIELVSDLGGGKTALVRGLAKGLGSMAQVSSPSFTLNNVYTSNNLALNHFDFYRLADAGIMAEELREVITDPEAVVVIEWAEIVRDVLPKECLTINIKNLGENERQLDFNYPSSLLYLLRDIT